MTDFLSSLWFPHRKLLEKARSLWPEVLKNLPMDARHKEKLIVHWRMLQPAFGVIAAG